MENAENISDYLFVKMEPPNGRVTNGSDLPAKTTERSSGLLVFTGFRQWLTDNLMLLVTLSGVLLGIVLGFSLRPLKLSEDSIILISYPGELFMRVLKLMILPLIISSLVAGSASINARMNGKIAMRTFIYFGLTSLFNAALGIALVVLIHPGDPDLHSISVQPATTKRDINLLDSLLDLGRNVFPENLFQATFQQAHTVYLPKPTIFPQLDDSWNDTTTVEPTIIEGSVKNGDNTNDSAKVELVREIHYRSGTNTLGIVFFCLVFGTCLGTIGSKGRVVIDFFSAIFEVVMKMVNCVMWLTPVGVTSVIAGKILSVEDLQRVTQQLMWFILTVAIGVLLYQLIVMQLIYFVVVRRNPFKFYAGLFHAMLTAFATAST